ncbi:transcription factor [Natrialba aegyptia]|uniref:Transcription factor n=1 Tax=Natrialba aegyptia DSM 13077 TaxID=1227491 RepID=M0B797_9EURY|nr:transcription factor [Natrialba aegyptia]ELZ06796.1 transcription factor [Natrialba aegyptia DSM 13077]
MPEVVNVVAAGNVGRELEIRAVGEDIDATEVKGASDEYQTPTLYLREQEDSPLVTVYESGSYHISGATSIEEAEKAQNWLIDSLESLDIRGLNPTFEVKNVVVVGDLEQSVDLNELVVRFGFEQTEYEPEQFPGLVYRPSDIQAVLLIFASGRVVIPGSPDVETGFAAFEMLRDRLNEYD